MLNREIFSWIVEVLGPCQLDLFTTQLNHQLNPCLSWKPDPFTVATDAFCISWKDKGGYAFPPFALIGRCLQKVREERATLVLKAPTWSAQAWYPALLEPLISDPLLLAHRPIQQIPPNGRSAISRLESVRRQHNDMGVSERSSKLIMAGWSTGTNTAYQSAWKRWCSWCAERKIDTLSCGVQPFLDFLADLFEQGLQH